MTVTDVVKVAHDLLKTVVSRRRKKAASEYGSLARTFTEAMRIWDAQKADGVSLEERQAGLEKSLKAAWPQVREWKYLCQTCEDTGWTLRICTPADPCGRPFTLPHARFDDATGKGRCSPGHSYVVSCWCPKGEERQRVLVKQKPMAAPEDFAAAGKQKPARIGR